MLRFLRGAIAAFSCVVLAGCGQGPVAVVGGEKISEKEFYAELERQAGRDAVLKLVMAEMITREAAAQGIVVSEEQLNQDLQRAMQQVGGPQAWERELARRGQTEASLRRERKLELLVRQLLTKDVTVSEEEVREFFEQNRRDYDRPALYAISEIVLDSKDEARRILAELKKPGADFASLAREHSVSDATAAVGGARPPTPLELIRPTVLQAVVEHLEPGELSDVVGADDFWYIVRLEDRTPPVKGDVRDPVIAEDCKERLRLQKGKSWPKLLEEMKAKYNVTILWPQYSFLQEEFASPEALPQFGTGAEPTDAGAGAELPPPPAEKKETGAGSEAGAKPEKKPAGEARKKQPTTPPSKKPEKPEE